MSAFISKILHDVASPLSALRLGLDWAENSPSEALPHLAHSVEQLEIWLLAYRQLLVTPQAIDLGKFARFWCPKWHHTTTATPLMLATLMVVLPGVKATDANLTSQPNGWRLELHAPRPFTFFDNIDAANVRMVLQAYVLERVSHLQESWEGTRYCCDVQPS